MDDLLVKLFLLNFLICTPPSRELPTNEQFKGAQA